MEGWWLALPNMTVHGQPAGNGCSDFALFARRQGGADPKRGFTEHLKIRYTNYMDRSFSRQRITLGISYGFTAGIFFSLAAWGVDAAILAQHHASLPLLKLIPGLLICLPAATLAGYLTAKHQKGFLGMLYWGALAVLLSFLVISLPINFQPWFLNAFRPQYRLFIGIEELVSSFTNWFYCLFAIGLTSMLCGFLENLLIDQALASSSELGPRMPQIICAVIMIVAGLFGDLLLTSDFRKPIIAMDTLLENAALYYGQEVDEKTERELRLGAATPLGELVLEPHSLTLASVDRYMTLMKVVVEFDEQVAVCQTINFQPTFCFLLKDDQILDENSRILPKKLELTILQVV